MMLGSLRASKSREIRGSWSDLPSPLLWLCGAHIMEDGGLGIPNPVIPFGTSEHIPRLWFILSPPWCHHLFLPRPLSSSLYLPHPNQSATRLTAQLSLPTSRTTSEE